MHYQTICKYISVLVLLLSVFTLHSCVSDEYGAPEGVVGKAQISLKLPSIQSVDAAVGEVEDKETVIRSLYLFVFDSNTGEKEFSTQLDIPYTTTSADVDMSRWLNDQVITILNSDILTNLSQERNIHVVANIEAGKLNGITTQSQLKATIVANDFHSSRADRTFLMHGFVSKHRFSASPLASISLVRNVAKIKMSINTQRFTFGGSNIMLNPAGQKISAIVCNVANTAFVLSSPTSPAQTTYYSYPIKRLEAESRTELSTDSSLESYVFENLRTTYDVEKNATYVLLQIPYQVEGGEVVMKNYYKVLINKENSFAINRNTIYDISLKISSLGGSTETTATLLDGQLNVLPWDEKTITSDISQTFLTVKETSSTIQVNSDFYYATNASSDNRSLQVDDSWLTATFDASDDNKIKLVANGVNYAAGRSTKMRIKVNNLTKVITINQKAAPVKNGSIALSPRVLYLSEVTPTGKATLSLTPNTAAWLQLSGSSSVASANLANGIGNKTIEFRRGTSYDNTFYQYANLATLEYDSLKICNLLLNVSSEEIGVPGDGGTFTETDIVAKGGDFKWVVKTKPSWITSATNVDGDLHYTVLAEPNEQDRTGVITIAHINDPNYTKDLHINQSAKYVRFPDYDYLVVRFLFAIGPDLDTATELTGTGISGLDKLPVGWSMGASQGIPRKYEGYDFIEWAGDNRTKGYEAVFVNMYNLCNPNYVIYDRLPRYFNIDLYACWYSKGIAPKPMDMEITLYKGGTMQRINEFDYKNNGGEQVHHKVYPKINITSETPSNSRPFLDNFRDNYTKIGTIRYDKFKNTATMTLGTSSSANNSRARRSLSAIPSKGSDFPVVEGESKDEFERRLNQYRDNQR